jgi:hypothetical protein
MILVVVGLRRLLSWDFGFWILDFGFWIRLDLPR